MKCKKCAKQVPDGFTDCPWCGAPGAQPDTLREAARASLPGDPMAASVSGQVSASAFDVRRPSWFALRSVLAFAGTLVCFWTVAYLNYLATLRLFGSGIVGTPFFYRMMTGRAIGSSIIPVLGGVLYYELRKKRPDLPSRIFAVSSWTVLCALFLFALARPRDPLEAMLRDAAASRAQLETVQPLPPTKWDSAIRLFYGDLSARYTQYVLAIEKLDTKVIPLYTPDSFRDAATIRQVLSQLQDRRAVANAFQSPELLLAKLPEYANGVEASDDERSQFVQEFDTKTRQHLVGYKVVWQNELEWLDSSDEIYRFALAHQGAYSIQNHRLQFQNKQLDEDFSRKLEVAQLRKLEFRRAQNKFVAMEDKLLKQAGLPPLLFSAVPRSPAVSR